MWKYFRYAGRMLIVILALMCCTAGQVLAQGSGEEKDEGYQKRNDRVLFISSYSWTWPTVLLQLKGIQSSLSDDVTLDVEFMDTKMLSEDMAQQQLLERIRFKEEQVGLYDAVIVGDDAALLFAMEYRTELFDGIPLVFEGINNLEYAQEVSRDPLVTGVIESFSYKENLDFAHEIQPEADKILAIVDNTVTGIGEQQQFYAQKDEYPQYSFDVINSSLLTEEELIKAISEVGNDTILVYLILSEDADGNVYTNSQVCSMIRQYAHVPVFRFVQAGIGEGVLGGNIVFHEKSGAIAGDMVMKILNGTDPASIDMRASSPNGFYLDQNVIEQFSIPEKLIPEGAVIVNQKQSFWRKYGQVIFGTLCVAAVIAGIIILCMRITYELRQKTKLEEKNRQLADAVTALQQANGAKSQFLAQMSHEIRTPMNAVIGLTAIAQNETEHPEKMKEYLKKIDASSRLLLGIINDILDMSAIERGKMKLEQAPFDFKKQLSDVVAMFYQQARQKKINFALHMNGVIEEYFIGDGLRVSQIMINLLSNAVKFTPPGGRIDFTVTQTSRSQGKVYMRFLVSDTGCGMSSDMMERLFKPFEQQDASTARRHGGSGLGLSITGNLVKMMGGTIRAESTLNEGSTFVVDIPFTSCEQKFRPVTVFKDIRALVIDDDEDACQYCGTLLDSLGVRYDYVTEGEAALEMLGEAEEKGDPYKLCIVDWQMVSMDGIEVVKQIRSIFGEEFVVIMASAYDLREIENEGREAGVNYFVAKPVFKSSLFNVLTWMAGSGTEGEHEEITKKYDFSGRHVLIAEDLDLNMEVAVRLLEMVGIQVSCAENGREALELYQKAPDGFFDCILLDVNMPEMDGYEAAQAIRKTGKRDASVIPVFAMTANAFTEDIKAAMDAGMNGHIAKPIEIDILYETLQEVFKNYEQV
ncbi:MAG: ABC transporter substrate binding protein [Lachnospiraceae bacterium]|nr:ABC transporter substrate binding protein [Lachnospiraceae bacterium]